MANISSNGLNLSEETTEELVVYLRAELYRDIDSVVAKEIMAELEIRE